MKSIVIIITFLLGFNSLLCQTANTDTQWSGIWLNKKYSEVLQETRSPFQAIESLPTDEPSVMIVDHSKKTTINLIYGMSDGVLRDVLSIDSIDSDRYLIRYISSEKNTKNKKTYQHEEYFLKIDTNNIQWIDSVNSKAQVVQFVRISIESNNYGNFIKQYISKQVLNNSFEDSRKQIYTFDSTGLAIWPQKTFQYTIGIDFVFSNCDYFTVDGEKKNGYPLTYSYKWKDGKLYLFHLEDDDAEFISPAPKPFVELRPISK